MEQLPCGHDGLGFVGHHLLCGWTPEEWILSGTDRQCYSDQCILGNSIGILILKYYLKTLI